MVVWHGTRKLVYENGFFLSAISQIDDAIEADPLHSELRIPD
jgi:hypothetical protein